jgi:hypothetical protein
MKRVLAFAASLSLALIFTPSLHADHHHRSAGTRAHVAPHVSAPHVSAAMRSFNAHRSVAGVPRTFVQRSTVPPRNFGAVTSQRSSSFALGGHPYVSRNSTIVSPSHRYLQPHVRAYTLPNRFTYRTPPSATFRSWDRHREHVWNNHRYRWAGNNWVILDGGFTYPYASSYSYPYSYYDDDYYSTTPEVTISTAPTEDSLGAEVQEALAAQGYYTDAIDGDVGPLTRQAIAAYQRDHGLPVTGTINAPLLDSLGLE